MPLMAITTKYYALPVENPVTTQLTPATTYWYSSRVVGAKGKTYSETSGESRGVAAELEAAMEDDPESPETLALQAQSEELNAKVQTLFRGEALRGLLLTSYGFSIFGERAGQAALVAFLVAAVLALASIAGFVHAFTTPKEETVHLA